MHFFLQHQQFILARTQRLPEWCKRNEKCNLSKQVLIILEMQAVSLFTDGEYLSLK